MSIEKLPRRQTRSEFAAYGCVATAIGFIMALTFGMFESPERPRDMAANTTSPAAISTP